MLTTTRAHITHSHAGMEIPLDIWLMLLSFMPHELLILKRTSMFFYHLIDHYIFNNSTIPHLVPIIQKKTLYWKTHHHKNKSEINAQHPIHSTNQKKRMFTAPEHHEHQPIQKKMRLTEETFITTCQALSIITNPSYTLTDRYRVLSQALNQYHFDANPLNIVSSPNQNHFTTIKWTHLKIALADPQTTDLAKNTLVNYQHYFTLKQRALLFSTVIELMQPSNYRGIEYSHQLNYFLIKNLLAIISTCIKPNSSKLFANHFQSLWNFILKNACANDLNFLDIVGEFLKNNIDLKNSFFNFIHDQIKTKNQSTTTEEDHSDSVFVFLKATHPIWGVKQKHLLCNTILTIFPQTPHSSTRYSMISLYKALQPNPTSNQLQHIINLIQQQNDPVSWMNAYITHWHPTEIKRFLKLICENSFLFNSTDLLDALDYWQAHSPHTIQSKEINAIIRYACDHINHDHLKHNKRKTYWQVLHLFAHHWSAHSEHFTWLLQQLSTQKSSLPHSLHHLISFIDQVWEKFNTEQQSVLFDQFHFIVTDGYADNTTAHPMRMEIMGFLSSHLFSWKTAKLKRAWDLFYKIYQHTDTNSISQLHVIMQTWELFFKQHQVHFVDFNHLIDQRIISSMATHTFDADRERDLMFLFNLKYPTQSQFMFILNIALNCSHHDNMRLRHHAQNKIKSTDSASLPQSMQKAIALHSMTHLNAFLYPNQLAFLKRCAAWWGKAQCISALPLILKKLNEHSHRDLWEIVHLCKAQLTKQEQHSEIHQPLSLLMTQSHFLLNLSNHPHYSTFIQEWNTIEIGNALNAVLSCLSINNLEEIHSNVIQWLIQWSSRYSSEQREMIFKHVITRLNNVDGNKSMDVKLATSFLPHWNNSETDTLLNSIFSILTEDLDTLTLRNVLKNLVFWESSLSLNHRETLALYLQHYCLTHANAHLYDLYFFGDYFNQKQILTLLNKIFPDIPPVYYSSNYAMTNIHFLRISWKNLDDEGKAKALDIINTPFALFNNQFKIMLFDLFSYWLSIDVCQIEQLRTLNAICDHPYWPLLEATHTLHLKLKEQSNAQPNSAKETELELIKNSLFHFPKNQREKNREHQSMKFVVKKAN